jgi:hypothetical protein
MFAEHNTAVFKDILGLSDKDIARLYESGATTNEPQYPADPAAGALSV